MFLLDYAGSGVAMPELKSGIELTEPNKTGESWSSLAELLKIASVKLRLDYVLGLVSSSYMRAFLTPSTHEATFCVAIR